MESPLNKFKSLILCTGNVLDNEEIFKRVKSPNQEISAFIDSRIQELKNENPPVQDNFVDHKLVLNEIAPDHDVEGIKVVVKIFINCFFEDSIQEIIDILPTMCVTKPSVILAYHPTSKNENSDKFIWGDNCEEYRKNFRKCWTVLRNAKRDGKISQLGLADIDLDSIQKMFDDEIGVDFTTLQINTQTCCVVPPELQTFCKERDIQLLTHSDPQVIFSSCNLANEEMKDFKVKWSLRHLETLVCRGILTKKSFAVKLIKA